MHVNLVARCLEEAAISAAIFTEHMKPARRVAALANFQDDPSVGEIEKGSTLRVDGHRKVG